MSFGPPEACLMLSILLVFGVLRDRGASLVIAEKDFGAVWFCSSHLHIEVGIRDGLWPVDHCVRTWCVTFKE